MTDLSAISRVLAPLQRRIMLMVGRAVLSAVREGEAGQTIQVTLLAEETRDQVDRPQPYGLATVPLAGAEAIVLCVGGNRDHPVAVVVSDNRGRPAGMADGEVALYSHLDGGGGHRIQLLADRSILVKGDRLRVEADTEVVVDAPSIKLGGGATIPVKLANDAAATKVLAE